MSTLVLIILATFKVIMPFIYTGAAMLVLHGIIYQVTGYSIYNELEKKLIK